jgi:hypothetical protein
MNMTTVQFLNALAMTESANDSCALGDFDSEHNPRAITRWQTHPDRLWNEAHIYHMQPRLSETWDSFVKRVLTAMHAHWQAKGKTDLEIAQFWHLGHFAAPQSADYDHEYAKRFSQYETWSSESDI